MSATAAIANSANTAIPAEAGSAASSWDIDTAHTSTLFRVRHLMVSHVRGQLGAVTGNLHLDDQDVSRSTADVRIDARQLDTRDAKRDEHLRSADFLDVARYPEVGFRSTSVRAARDGGLQVTGELTIRDVTRPITLEVDPLSAPVADPWGNVKRGATARASLNRKDFGLVWNVGLETGGVLVGDKVDIEIEVELVRSRA